MTMHTEIYCPKLADLDLMQAVRAIHQAYLQLAAVDRHCDVEPYDNGPALAALKACLVQAGHAGFTP